MRNANAVDDTLVSQAQTVKNVTNSTVRSDLAAEFSKIHRGSIFCHFLPLKNQATSTCDLLKKPAA